MLDAYEVLRQFIDATDNLENCVIFVIAPQNLSRMKNGAYHVTQLSKCAYGMKSGTANGIILMPHWSAYHLVSESTIFH